MNAETESALLDWANDDRDPGDDLHRHFGSFGRWDWCEIADEARRVWNLMFEEEVEDLSPKDGVWSAVAAQASHGAYASVAAALGVSPEDLELAVAEWYENQDELPAPVGTDGLLAKIAEAKQFRADLAAGKYDLPGSE